MTEDEKHARAAEIIANLKNAGGWDLTGYEFLFVPVDPVFVDPGLGPLGDNCMRLKMASGKWLELGRVPSLCITHEVEEVQLFIDAPPVRGIPARRSIKIFFDIEARPEIIDIAVAGDQVEAQIGIHRQILSTNIIIIRYDMEYGAGAMMTVEAVATGEMQHLTGNRKYPSVAP